MKRISLIMLFLITIVPCLFAVEIWVSPKGNDQNTGTADAPFATLQMAQRKARELRRVNDPSIKDGITIIMKGGTYTLTDQIVFRPEDSGTAESPTVIKSADGEMATLSGGVKVTSWVRCVSSVAGLPQAAIGKVWEAPIPKVGGYSIQFRQMWVDNVKCQRASNLQATGLPRILSVDGKNQAFWIPKPTFDVQNINQLEMVIHQWWAIAMLRVKAIEVAGDSTKVTFHQPESKIEFEHPWPAPFIDELKELNGNSAFFFTNSMALLDEPGEWFADVEKGKIYYWPRVAENIETANVVVPNMETLVTFDGTLDKPVSNIQFIGIGFEHTGWLRPSQKGHVPLQAGWSITEAYKLQTPGTVDKAALENQAWVERQSAGVVVNNANHIQFNSCSFEHMAATAIDFVSGTHHNFVEGCLIQDVGGTGIQIGFFGSPEYEVHVPYNPTDGREVCQFETISNNVITNVTNEDWGCVGISVGYAHDVNIEHNEVSHLNYSGICVGWGWTKTINCMKNNRVYGNYIHHFAKNMYDVGGVYTLSAQPNSIVSGNRIEHLEKAPYAHIPIHYQYIYYDEGSSYIRSEDNWTEVEKFFSNTPGPGNEWINNGPLVADSIKSKAGLTDEFKVMLNKQIKN